MFAKQPDKYHVVNKLLCTRIFRYFEDQLKQRYAALVAGLEEFILHDQLVAPKIKAMTAVYKLLVSKAELEQRLLRMLANKELENPWRKHGNIPL